MVLLTLLCWCPVPHHHTTFWLLLWLGPARTSPALAKPVVLLILPFLHQPLPFPQGSPVITGPPGAKAHKFRARGDVFYPPVGVGEEVGASPTRCFHPERPGILLRLLLGVAITHNVQATSTPSPNRRRPPPLRSTREGNDGETLLNYHTT